MVADFWQGRRVFLTGHTGFIGGWLALWLVRHGAKVWGFSLEAPTEPNFFNAVELEKIVHSTRGDIRDFDALSSCLATAHPEIVLHLAAQPIVREAYADPLGTLSTNVMGTANLLQAMRALKGIRAAVIMTTDKVYENLEWPWGYRENDRLGGKEPYGVSKACAELVTEAYRRSYFGAKDRNVAIATVRAGNVFGGGDWAADRLVPDAARAFAQPKSLRVRNPQSVRPWQHVLEPVHGIALLTEALASDAEPFAGPWNFGPIEDDARPVRWIADRLASAWSGGAKWEVQDGLAPYEARVLKLSSAKARSELGWKPRWTLEQSIDRTVAWYKSFYQGGNDMRGYSLNQIEEYLSA